MLQFCVNNFTKAKIIQLDPTNKITSSEKNLNLYILKQKLQIDLLILKKFFKDPNLQIFCLDDANCLEKLKEFDAIRKNDPTIQINLIPVTVLWGRQNCKNHSQFQKVLKQGKNCFIYLHKAIDVNNFPIEKANLELFTKFIRLVKISEARLRFMACGNMVNQQKLTQTILQSANLQKIIEQEAKIKKISISQATNQAKARLDEIASKMNFKKLKFAERFLSWLWNKIYQGIQTANTEKLYKVAMQGSVLVYVPCHRSHIDYLLLSYILYHKGLMVPHIAAGINLNFFPVGSFFRSWGAFFIRRSFAGDRLYPSVFREYLSYLLQNGNCVEYFIEGGRSRTGKLLDPKTGMLVNTLQSAKELTRKVVFVPVYIGYENVIETATYAKELQGKKKSKESSWLALQAVKKLINLGQAQVNFGEPIKACDFLSENLNEDANNLAIAINTKINQACAVNAKNLIGIILVNAENNILPVDNLFKQIDSILALFKNVPYSPNIILPTESAQNLVKNLLNLPRSGIKKSDNQISLSNVDGFLMEYYRNNILHLFMLPALVAKIALTKHKFHLDDLNQIVATLYPFIKQELFMHFSIKEAKIHSNEILQEFTKQNLIVAENAQFTTVSENLAILENYAQNISDCLIRLNIAVQNFEIDLAKSKFEIICFKQAKDLIKNQNFSDRSTFGSIFKIFKAQNFTMDQIKQLQNYLQQLL